MIEVDDIVDVMIDLLEIHMDEMATDFMVYFIPTIGI